MSAIWVVVQHRDGKLHRGSREAVAAGQALAAATGGAVSAFVLGADTAALAAELAAFDLATVERLESPALAGYTPGAYVAALREVLKAKTPAFVLAPHTYQTIDFFPRLACEAGGALISEAVSFAASADGIAWQRPVFAGKLVATVRPRGAATCFISLQSGAFAADAARTGLAEVHLHALAAELNPQRELLGVESSAADQVDLTKAEAIVGIGRGIGAPEKMGAAQELASLLGAEIGASRPVIDSGWLPRERQVGSSGQTVAPKLYVALGISGAIQHLVGMKASSCIVAINKDSGAPIFKVATYGIVGDVHELVPAINQALRERAS